MLIALCVTCSMYGMTQLGDRSTEGEVAFGALYSNNFIYRVLAVFLDEIPAVFKNVFFLSLERGAA